MNEFNIIPVSIAQTKREIAQYTSECRVQVINALYKKFEDFQVQYWPGVGLPDAIIEVCPMDMRELATYRPKCEFGIPHIIALNSAFVALNWHDTRKVEGERTLVDHVLLHEMIHLYLETVAGEVYDSLQAAHGLSFRREAARVGLQGRGRLMTCPYEVRMPIATRKRQVAPSRALPGRFDQDAEVAQAVIELGKAFRGRKLKLQDFESGVKELLLAGD